MKIRFSRHARRRLKLYKILEATVREILIRKQFDPGPHALVEKVEGQRYPLKIVVIVEKEITVVTNYPLKKARVQ
ncbi:MAG: DUF4258 domain-containing protein [Candidatus Hydrogenedentes bacterium]|nr:DUF4258 domain-containing protein [Candidatus Hydrogenedentota bacterium]